MNKILLILSVCTLFFSVEAFAQKKKTTKKRTSSTKAKAKKPKTGAAKPGGTTEAPPTTAAAAPAPSADTTPLYRKSLNGRDAAVKDINQKDRTPVEYEQIRIDDVAYLQRLWEEIDLREKMNQVFVYGGEDDNGSGKLIMLIINALKDPKNELIAFSTIDDRFTTPLSKQELGEIIGGGKPDTIDVLDPSDPSGTRYIKKIIPKYFNPDDIIRFRTKGEWIFDKETGRLVWRLLGIAPITVTKEAGKIIPGAEAPMFWIHYPDFRKVFAKVYTYNPKNMGQRMTWEELFEGRWYSSFVTKSSMDNPQDLRIKDIYTNPVLALYEGERIRNKIFDYEQNLWSY
jgi:gliding motility associated protien GldN